MPLAIMQFRGGSGISPGGPQPQRWECKSIIWQNFCRKLHKIERNWTERDGGGMSLAPLSVADPRGGRPPYGPKFS